MCCVPVNISSLHKSLHSIFLIYRASPTNDVTLAQLVVKPDEPVQKIVSFISALSEMTSPLPPADEKKKDVSFADLWPGDRSSHFINIDGVDDQDSPTSSMVNWRGKASVKGSCLRRYKKTVFGMVVVAIAAIITTTVLLLNPPAGPPSPPPLRPPPPPPPPSPSPPSRRYSWSTPSPPPPLPPPPDTGFG